MLGILVLEYCHHISDLEVRFGMIFCTVWDITTEVYLLQVELSKPGTFVPGKR